LISGRFNVLIPHGTATQVGQGNENDVRVDSHSQAAGQFLFPLLSLELKMITRVLVILVSIATFNLRSASQEIKPKMFPDVGDTVAVMPRDTSAFRLIVFLPQIACSGCSKSISPMVKNLKESTRATIDVTVFIASDDDQFVRQQKVIYDWDFEVHADPIRAYQKTFGISRAPYAILTNRCGVVLAAGPVGASSYDWEKVTIANRDLIRECNMGLSGITLRKSVVLRGSDAIAGAGMQRQVNIFGDSLVIVNATPLHKVMMFNMSGDSLMTFSHLPAEGYVPLTPILVNQPYSGRRYLFIDFTYDGDIPITTIVDFNGQVIERQRCRDYPSGSGRFYLSFTTDSSLETIVSGYRYLSRADRGSDRTGCVIWDRATGDIVQRFDRDSIHEKADLSNYHWTTSWIDDDEIAFVSNLSREVNVYGRKDVRRTRVLQFSPDTTAYRTGWLSLGMRLNEQSSLEDRQALQVHVSATSRLLKDTETGDYYIAFHNFTVSGYIDTFVSGPIGKPETGTWFVGRNHHVHKIAKNSLYTTAVKDGKLVLNQFELSR
jgi:hypothetical protein